MISKELIEKYFRNNCSPEEASRVLDWFCTDAGRAYLSNKFDVDADHLNDERIKILIHGVDSEGIYNRIVKATHSSSTSVNPKADRRGMLVAMRVAATFLVLVLTSWLVVNFESGLLDPTDESTTINQSVHSTGENEIRDLLLKDGSRVRLNENSELTIGNDYSKSERRVMLKGEAYFDVKNLGGMTFVVETDDAQVEVLGTAFNVNSYKRVRDEVQLSVVEGRVRFKSLNKGEMRDSILVEAGQFGVYNLNSDRMQLEHGNPSNYLYWMSRRIVYEDETMSVVCDQISRIYGYECLFEEDDILSKKITANFSENGIEKTLSVVSMSLGLDYEFMPSEKKVKWL